MTYSKNRSRSRLTRLSPLLDCSPLSSLLLLPLHPLEQLHLVLSGLRKDDLKKMRMKLVL